MLLAKRAAANYVYIKYLNRKVYIMARVRQTAVFNMAMTPDEKQKLEVAADALGVSMSAFVRMACMATVAKTLKSMENGNVESISA